MKPTLLSLLLFAAPVAFASGPVEPVAAGATEAPPADVVVDDATVAIHAADADAASERRCVRDTGTRVAARDEDGCTALPGESYDRDDIDRTGAVDTADAIRRLTPSATVRR